jgi:hypothetical protein
MSLLTSQMPGLITASNLFAAVLVAFGVNAILRPRSGLELFRFKAPVCKADQKLVHGVTTVYGVRDIFMGLAIYVVARSGDRNALGWIFIAMGVVVFVDGAAVRRANGGAKEHLGAHWAFVPVLTGLGSVFLGAFD